MENQFSLAFVLYKDKNIMMQEIGRNYQKIWQEPLKMNIGADGIKGEIAQFSYVISFVDEPIDKNEMNQIAKHNPFFEEGEKVANHHQCHAIVGVKGVSNPVARYKVLTKLLAAMVSSYNAVGVYLGEQQLFYGREFLLKQSELLKRGQLPIAAWVYFGFYAHDHAFWVYTKGMPIFGREELEISSDSVTMQTLHEILMYLSVVLVSTHRQFEEGEVVEVGEYYLSVTHQNSPTLGCPTLLFHFEND